MASTLLGQGGGTRRTAYANAGRTQTATDEVGQVTVSTFDPLGRLLSVTNALGDSRTLTYDGNGNKVSETDFRGNATVFTYDDWIFRFMGSQHSEPCEATIPEHVKPTFRSM